MNDKRPLDFHLANRTGLVRFARLYSNIVSPPVMFAILGLAVCLHLFDGWVAWAWSAAYGFFVSLAPIIFVLVLLRLGYVKELHMSDTRERHWPYIVSVLSASVMYGIAYVLDAPELLLCLLIFNVIELAALGVINIFWLISLHSTGIMATMALVWLIWGWMAGLFILPVVISVCWVRLYLKRHTVGQVVAGLGLGVASVWVLTWAGCFV